MLINEYIKKNLGEKIFEQFNNVRHLDPYYSIRVNTIKSNINDFKSKFSHLEQHKYVKESFYYNKSNEVFSKYPYHDGGMYYLQDASASMVAYLLNPSPSDKVLDMCAAPGGKTTQLAAYMDNKGLIVANDSNYKRAIILKENVTRLGIANTIVTSATNYDISNRFSGYFDKVVLDVPCSGMGMIRKNKEMINDFSESKVLGYQSIQKKLILDGYNCLKQGGVMIYSTCTFTTQENEEVIKYLLSKTNAQLIPIKMEEDFEDGIDLKGPIRLYPFKFKGEGHFICLIKCLDNHETNLNTHIYFTNRKNKEIYKEFEKENLTITLPDRLISFGETIYLLPEYSFNLDNLKVLNAGLEVGKISSNIFKPSQALAFYLNKNQVKNIINFNENDLNLEKYLKGETIIIPSKKGYNLILVDNLSLGWVKSDGSICKNLYQKNIRRRS